MFTNGRMIAPLLKRSTALLSGLLLAGMLAACGSNGANGANGANANNASQSASAAASPEAAPQTDASPAASEAAGATRVVSTVMGDVTVPAEPKRIAGMLYVFADHLLALGIEPMAMVTYNDLGFPSYLADGMPDTIAVGSGEAPNLEKLLEAKPDLILASKTMNEAGYDQLSKIAPTILFDNENEDDWQRFRDTAAILGLEAKADEIKAQYDAKVAKARDELAKVAPGETVAYMRVQDKQLQLIQPSDNFTLFGALGLTPASVEGIDFKGSWNVAISEELLPELNPDRLFIILRPGQDNKEALDHIMDTPIWKSLKAVQNDRVYIGDANLWFAGFGPIGLGKVIDEITGAFGISS
ncbi:ABC transporter substrate-binding protein [Cohnella sp. GCM10012308]|uniref:ABC transporter substrate-binding protein n=1 Tax=Cohnella sp. GCM10012308 TaxID=3317329 RepID=UPI00361E8EBD